MPPTDDFRAVRAAVPAGGVAALPTMDSSGDPAADAYMLQKYIAEQRAKLAADREVKPPAPQPSLYDNTLGRLSMIEGAKWLANNSPVDVAAGVAKGVYDSSLSAASLPGDVAAGRTNFYNPDGTINEDVLRRSFDLAGMVTLGAGAIPAEANALRMGASFVPPTEAERAVLRAERAAKKDAKAANKAANELTTKNIPLPLKTREGGLYSKAEQVSLAYNQPQTTVGEFVNFLKGKGVKKSEIDALGLSSLPADQVRPTDEIREMITSKTPVLQRVEYTGEKARHKSHTEAGGENYREVIYTLPMNRSTAAIVPTEAEVRQQVTEQIRASLERIRARYAERGEVVPDLRPEDIETAINSRVQTIMSDSGEQVSSGVFTAPSHWGNLENPLFHLRMKDVQNGNRKTLRLEEVQSDWGQTYSKYQRGQGANAPPNAPWVTDDSWVDLAAKKSIVEAVASGADEIELTPGIVHANRWAGETALMPFYDEKFPGALDRAIKEAGGKVGEKMERETRMNFRQVNDYEQDLEASDIYYIYGLDTGRTEDANVWYRTLDLSRTAAHDPEAYAKQIENLHKLHTGWKETIAETEENLKKAREKFEKVNEIDLDDMTNEQKQKWFDLDKKIYELRSRIGQSKASLRETQQKLLAADLVPQVLGEVKAKFGLESKRYVLPITDEVREFVKTQGFKNFSKGGVVDLANYLAWST